MPAAHSIAIISAGATGSGGYATVMRLTVAAREMGLRAIGIIDGDVYLDAKKFFIVHSNDADALIRLPSNAAIEYAIVHDVPTPSICQALGDACAALNLPAIPNLNKMLAKEVEDQAIAFIKKNALHAAFIEALPFGDLPSLAKQALEKAVLAAREQLNGVIQL